MIRANSSCGPWFGGSLSMAFGLVLHFMGAIPAECAGKTPETLAWRGDEESEELEGSFDERARELHEWLRQRDSDRHQSWGNDVVTPENRAPSSPPRYFGDRVYDSQGYRRLNENTRFRLRTQEPSWNAEEDTDSSSLRLTPKNFRDSPSANEAAGEDTSRTPTLWKKAGGRRNKRKGHLGHR